MDRLRLDSLHTSARSNVYILVWTLLTYVAVLIIVMQMFIVVVTNTNTVLEEGSIFFCLLLLWIVSVLETNSIALNKIAALSTISLKRTMLLGVMTLIMSVPFVMWTSSQLHECNSLSNYELEQLYDCYLLHDEHSCAVVNLTRSDCLLATASWISASSGLTVTNAIMACSLLNCSLVVFVTVLMFRVYVVIPNYVIDQFNSVKVVV